MSTLELQNAQGRIDHATEMVSRRARSFAARQANNNHGGKVMLAPHLPPETMQKLVTAVTAGVSFPSAASFAGVSRVSFDNWLRTGRRALEVAEGDVELVPKELRTCAELVLRVEQAFANFEVGAIGQIRQAAKDDPRLLTWLLSKRLPDVYGDKSTLVIEERVGTALASALDALAARLPPEVYRQVLEALALDDGSSAPEVVADAQLEPAEAPSSPASAPAEQR